MASIDERLEKLKKQKEELKTKEKKLLAQKASAERKKRKRLTLPRIPFLTLMLVINGFTKLITIRTSQIHKVLRHLPEELIL